MYALIRAANIYILISDACARAGLRNDLRKMCHDIDISLKLAVFVLHKHRSHLYLLSNYTDIFLCMIHTKFCLFRKLIVCTFTVAFTILIIK